MNRRQQGFFSRQTALLMLLLGVVLVFAIPRLNDFSDKTRVTEAWHLASESKLRLNEFYKLSARFPMTEAEMQSVTSSVFRQPDFVSAVVVEHESADYDVVVKVFLKQDLVATDSGDEAFIYMAGTRSGSLGLDWDCGASGVDTDLLPRACS